MSGAVGAGSGADARAQTLGRVRVERAGLERLDELVRWRMEVLREVFSLDDEADLRGLEAANRAYYERELARGGHVSCLAFLNGEAVGCGGVCLEREMPSPDNPGGKCGYLMNVYTRPAARGRGVGAAVVDRLVREARSWGAGKVYLETSEAGRALYRSAGFVDLPDMLILPRNDV